MHENNLTRKKDSLDFEPGELRLFRIQPAEETPYTVEYYLDK